VAATLLLAAFGLDTDLTEDDPTYVRRFAGMLYLDTRLRELTTLRKMWEG
jgi:hypothetical protein